MELEIKNNQATQRFETIVEGLTAFINYKLRPGILTVFHTEVPKALEGRGIATSLTKHVLDYVAAEKLEIIPLCPFITSFLKKHPEYESLVKK
jgi:predicted GNAT family acetyltransferase